jgi:hypothetical protein
VQATPIVELAENDFVQAIRVALLVATVLLAMAFLAGWRWFPRGIGASGHRPSVLHPSSTLTWCNLIGRRIPLERTSHIRNALEARAITNRRGKDLTA